MKTSNKFDATVADGIRCYAEYRKGSTPELDRWSKTYLTAKGQQIVSDIPADADEATIRSEITRAVQAGY